MLEVYCILVEVPEDNPKKSHCGYCPLKFTPRTSVIQVLRKRVLDIGKIGMIRAQVIFTPGQRVPKPINQSVYFDVCFLEASAEPLEPALSRTKEHEFAQNACASDGCHSDPVFGIVIANSKSGHRLYLPAVASCAALIVETFRSLGFFRVIEFHDITNSQLADFLAELQGELRQHRRPVLVLYYAGHGATIDGGNVAMVLHDGFVYPLCGFLNQLPAQTRIACFADTCRPYADEPVAIQEPPRFKIVRRRLPDSYIIFPSAQGMAVPDTNSFAKIVADVLSISGLSMDEIYDHIHAECRARQHRSPPQFVKTGVSKLILNPAREAHVVPAPLQDERKSSRPKGNRSAMVQVAAVSLPHCHGSIQLLTTPEVAAACTRTDFKIVVLQPEDAVAIRDCLIPAGQKQVGPILRLYPENITFSMPASLLIPLPDDAMHWPRKAFRVWRRDNVTGKVDYVDSVA